MLGDWGLSEAEEWGAGGHWEEQDWEDGRAGAGS